MTVIPERLALTICKMYRDGLSSPKIGEHYDIGEKRIRRVLHLYGVTMRGPGPVPDPACDWYQRTHGNRKSRTGASKKPLPQAKLPWNKRMLGFDQHDAKTRAATAKLVQRMRDYEPEGRYV